MQSTQHFTYIAPSTWALLYIVWSLSSGACRWRSRCHEFPPCRSVLSNGLVRGRCGADGQRTDDDCEQCRTEVAAPYESVSHHWWRILTNGHWESVWGTKCPVRRSSLIISQLPTMSLRHIGISAEYIKIMCYRGAAWFPLWYWIAIYSDPVWTLPHELCLFAAWSLAHCCVRRG